MAIQLVLCLCWGCKSDPNNPDAQIPFDREQWRMKEGAIYPFRDQMVDAVLYSDTLRKLNKVELLEWLGKPDREQENHLYYTIRENRLGLWTLQLKSLVVKIDKEDSVEWIKLYE